MGRFLVRSDDLAKPARQIYRHGGATSLLEQIFSGLLAGLTDPWDGETHSEHQCWQVPKGLTSGSDDCDLSRVKPPASDHQLAQRRGYIPGIAAIAEREGEIAAAAQADIRRKAHALKIRLA